MTRPWIWSLLTAGCCGVIAIGSAGWSFVGAVVAGLYFLGRAVSEATA